MLLCARLQVRALIAHKSSRNWLMREIRFTFLIHTFRSTRLFKTGGRLIFLKWRTQGAGSPGCCREFRDQAEREASSRKIGTATRAGHGAKESKTYSPTWETQRKHTNPRAARCSKRVAGKSSCAIVYSLSGWVGCYSPMCQNKQTRKQKSKQTPLLPQTGWYSQTWIVWIERLVAHLWHWCLVRNI